MKKTNNDIYEIRNIWTKTTAAEAVLTANADKIRNAIIEIETEHDDTAILAEIAQYDDEIYFDYIITDETTAEQHVRSRIRSACEKIEIIIFRRSDADAESTSEEWAAEHAEDVLGMIEYYISGRSHVIVL